MRPIEVVEDSGPAGTALLACMPHLLLVLLLLLLPLLLRRCATAGCLPLLLNSQQLHPGW
jgi:hypothetical protein